MEFHIFSDKSYSGLRLASAVVATERSSVYHDNQLADALALLSRADYTLCQRRDAVNLDIV